MSEEWFHWYVAQIGKEKQRSTFRNRFLCPCCFMPTLEERAGYEICPICFWEDDGQDSDDAETVRGGPNGDYSLREARDNFNNHHTMYRPSDKNAFDREMSQMSFKKKMYHAFKQAMQSNDESDWLEALRIENEYHKRSG